MVSDLHVKDSDLTVLKNGSLFISKFITKDMPLLVLVTVSNRKNVGELVVLGCECTHT